MSSGYFKVYRKLIKSSLWLQEPFTRGQAWVDLVGMARHRDGYGRKRGIRIEIARGCLLMSEQELAERWQWSRGKVRRFLYELRMEHQIELQKSNVSTLIKIENYETYQGSDTADDTANGQQTVQQTDRNNYNRKNGKNGKNENNNTPPTPPGGSVSVLKSYPYPDWLNKDLWADFHRMRSRIKKPITTERTITGLINKLKSIIDDGHDQDEVIQAAVTGCWLSFYPPKGNGDGHKPKTNLGPNTRESRGSDGGCSKYDGITQTIVDCG